MKDPLKEKVRPRRRPSSSGRLGKSTDRNPPAHEAQERKLSQRMPRGWQAGFRKAFDQAGMGLALVGFVGGGLRFILPLCKFVAFPERDLFVTASRTFTNRQ